MEDGEMGHLDQDQYQCLLSPGRTFILYMCTHVNSLNTHIVGVDGMI